MVELDFPPPRCTVGITPGGQFPHLRMCLVNLIQSTPCCNSRTGVMSGEYHTSMSSTKHYALYSH